MSLKDILRIVIKLTFIFSILLFVVGGLLILTGMGAITGIPVVLLGYFLMHSQQYLKAITEDTEITKNLFLYFKEMKLVLIIGFVIVITAIVSGVMGYFYFSNLLNNIIF